jgi:hypothetical protein
MDGAQQTGGDDGAWKYNPANAATPVNSPAPQPQVAQPQSLGIRWTASEFIAHQKNGGWYGILALGALVASVIVYLITKDIVSSVVILLAAVAFGVVAARQPRELGYQVDGQGLIIGNKEYAYGMFRSFSVIQEGAFASIVFVPLKRFAPLTTIYYDPADEDTIIGVISQHLPMQQRSNDVIDRLMWRIRF